MYASITRGNRIGPGSPPAPTRLRRPRALTTPSARPTRTRVRPLLESRRRRSRRGKSPGKRWIRTPPPPLSRRSRRRRRRSRAAARLSTPGRARRTRARRAGVLRRRFDPKPTSLPSAAASEGVFLRRPGSRESRRAGQRAASERSGGTHRHALVPETRASVTPDAPRPRVPGAVDHHRVFPRHAHVDRGRRLSQQSRIASETTTTITNVGPLRRSRPRVDVRDRIVVRIRPSRRPNRRRSSPSPSPAAAASPTAAATTLAA